MGEAPPSTGCASRRWAGSGRWLWVVLCVACGSSGGAGDLAGAQAAPWMTDALPLWVRSILQGESDAAPREHPAVGVLMRVRDRPARQGTAEKSACGATLIAPDIILTAAHCLLQPKAPHASIRLYFSLAADVTHWQPGPRGPPMPVVEVVDVAVHPGFVAALPAAMGAMAGLGRLNDIGLGFLAASIDGVPPQKLIAPEHVDELRRHTPVTILGYGSTRPGFDALASESVATMWVRRQAQSYIEGLGPFEMQVGGQGPSARRCHGDSGGPTLFLPAGASPGEEELIGVGSHTFDEARCMHGHVDTRVDRYLGWIHAHIHRSTLH